MCLNSGGHRYFKKYLSSFRYPKSHLNAVTCYSLVKKGTITVLIRFRKKSKKNVCHYRYFKKVINKHNLYFVSEQKQ